MLKNVKIVEGIILSTIFVSLKRTGQHWGVTWEG